MFVSACRVDAEPYPSSGALQAYSFDLLQNLVAQLLLGIAFYARRRSKCQTFSPSVTTEFLKFPAQFHTVARKGSDLPIPDFLWGMHGPSLKYNGKQNKTAMWCAQVQLHLPCPGQIRGQPCHYLSHTELVQLFVHQCVSPSWRLRPCE